MKQHVLKVDGHDVRWYLTGPEDAELTVFWHHGTPNTGEPPEPLLAPAAERGIRFLSLDRPGYGGSEPVRARTVLDITKLVSKVAAAAGVSRFAVMGHSGGGPHALATASQLADAVPAVATIAGLAPLRGLRLQWWEGMRPLGMKELGAAVRGEVAVRSMMDARAYDPKLFSDSDHDALDRDWGWFYDIVAQGIAGGLEGMALDDLAYLAPWGFWVSDVKAPTLVVHGGEDRIVPVKHGQWLAKKIPATEYWERPADGHISIMRAGDEVLDWLLARAREAA